MLDHVFVVWHNLTVIYISKAVIETSKPYQPESEPGRVRAGAGGEAENPSGVRTEKQVIGLLSKGAGAHSPLAKVQDWMIAFRSWFKCLLAYRSAGRRVVPREFRNYSRPNWDESFLFLA